MSPKMEGMFTALATPFYGEQIDEKGLKFSIQRQLKAGVDGLVILGTTGEASALTREERRTVIQLTVAEVAGQIPVIVGCSSNCTAAAVELAQEAKQLQADLCLSVAPYYCKPTQEGIIQHFKTLAEQGGLPVILYNNPGRSAVPITVESVQTLAVHPKIVGIKDVSGDAMQISQLTASVPTSFAVLCGDEVTVVPWMSVGAAGIISGGANAAPQAMVQLVGLVQQGRWSEARELHQRLLPLFHFLAVESNPIPLKALLTQMTLPSGGCRLPMTDLSSRFETELIHLTQQLTNEWAVVHG